MTSAIPPQDDPYGALRRLMVEKQLRARGIQDQRVLEALATVPRHLFVSPGQQQMAYEDRPLSIGEGQTISQPYMVARMSELCQLEPAHRVLEVGAGCGYQSAVLAQLCRRVYAMELIPALAEQARATLTALEVENVTLVAADGSLGWPTHAPYDAILVAAGAPAVPEALKQQLAEGGRLVIPVGGRGLQVLQRITRRGASFLLQEDTPCRFVDLRGAGGWDSPGTC